MTSVSQINDLRMIVTSDISWHPSIQLFPEAFLDIYFASFTLSKILPTGFFEKPNRTSNRDFGLDKMKIAGFGCGFGFRYILRFWFCQ